MRLAEKQHGIITVLQATAGGLTAEAVRHRVDSGRWEPAGGGAYRLIGTPRTWEQRLFALAASAGGTAAASHRSAAALLGLPGFPRSGVCEVTTPRPRRHRGAEGICHRWRVLPEHHLTVVDAIPVTRVARTLVDLAGILHPQRVERAVDNCLAMGVVTVAGLRSTHADLATRGRAGIALMRRLLDERSDAYVPPASELEARFLALVRDSGLPDPVRQLDAGDREGWVGRVDFAWPSVGLLVELDSRRHHSALLDRKADAARDARLRSGGWYTVVRITWDEVATRPEVVGARLWRLLRPTAA